MEPIANSFFMELYTPVILPSDLPQLTHRDQTLLMGSCFATHIGTRLKEAKFTCDVNPYGVLYNPLSIVTALEEIDAGKEYAETDLYQHRFLWHSPMHHSDFSASTASETVDHINRRLRQARRLWEMLDVLMLTWGSAYVYRNRSDGRIVGNCHKLPESTFLRGRLSVSEIVDAYRPLLTRLLTRRPSLKVTLTVSPIRHLRDGLHANQLSKATLLLAADELQKQFAGHVCYFPAYELLMDELRDYRFYADDLTHPSAMAVEYVWECWQKACFSPETRLLANECLHINRGLEHKPFRPQSEEYKRFLKQIVLKIDQLNEKYPYLDFEKERELCRTRLNAFVK